MSHRPDNRSRAAGRLRLVGYHDGTWTRYLDVDGLDYRPAGAENCFSTGPIYAVTEGPDGDLWALSRQVLPESDSTIRRSS